MPLNLETALQDTTVVTLARDGIGLLSAWMTVGIGVAFVVILIVLLLVLSELRLLSRTWATFLNTTAERSVPLVEHANNAARNLDRITEVVRSEVDRFDGAVGEVADDIGRASAEVKRRVADLSALVDLAQSEAEDAVLDAAAAVRMLRQGTALLRGRGEPADEDTEEPPVASEDS
ncbi:MAG: hypothetical protein OXN18_05120 [Gemmatimonadota bacterium]|nr:hypothetical protein [Gemmatimonadota bacterium]